MMTPEQEEDYKIDKLLDLPYISQSLSLFKKHVNDDQIDDYILFAKRQFFDKPLPKENCSCTGPLPHDDGDRFFTELWRAFAASNSRLVYPLGPRLEDYDNLPNGASLAWAYIQYSGDVKPISLDNQVTDSAWQGLSMALMASGVDPFEFSPIKNHSTRAWATVRGTMFDNYLRIHNYSGISFFFEPKLRDNVVLCSDISEMPASGKWKPKQKWIQRLYLHEHIHGAMAEAALPDETIVLSPLRSAINEGVTELLARAGVSIHHNVSTDEFGHSAFSGTAYNRSVTAMLSLIPAYSPTDLRLLWLFGRDNLQAKSDKAVAKLLSEIACENHSAKYWLEYFTSSERRVRVLFADGTEIYLKGALQHREDGPAVFGPEVHTEWWMDGEKVEPLIILSDQEISDIIGDL
jgi:hypothetical protein